jgi:hypothetical protein
VVKEEIKIAKGHCPKCGPGRSADIVGQHEESWYDDEAAMGGSIVYRIMRCRGCETPYFQTDETNSENYSHRQNAYGEEEWELDHKIDHWPSPTRREQPIWSVSISVSDRDLGYLFEDIYGALNSDLRVPAAIAIRTALDRASQLLGIDASKTFAQKLEDLEAAGKISGDEKMTLSALIDAGNAAAHRGWRPSLADLDTMMSLLEGFLHRNFVLGDLAKQLQSRVPAKLKKSAKKKGST